MAIRLRDQTSFLGRIAATLQPATAAFVGTFTAAAARTGTIAASLQNATASFAGFFTPAPNRTGAIAATLQNATAAILGSASSAGAPVWSTVPQQDLSVGVSYSSDLDTFCTGALYYAVVSGTLPAGLTLNPTTGVVSGTPTTGGTSNVTIRAFDTVAEGDFFARSNAAGVVAFYGFDTQQEITDLAYPNAQGQIRVFRDTVQSIGYGSAARFDILASDPPAANCSGSLTNQGDHGLPFSNMFKGQKFGSNSTFYVQYRMRISASMLTNYAQWQSNFKVSLFHFNNETATSLELTLGTYYGQGMDITQASGAYAMWSQANSPNFAFDGSARPQQGWDLVAGGPPWNVEPNSYHMAPGTYTQFPVDEWITMYFKVTLGTLRDPSVPPQNFSDSSIEAWLKRDGSPTWHKWCSVKYSQSFDHVASDGYNNMTLTPYMTGLNVAAPVDAFMWFDEVIISSQPIATPLVK